MKTKTILFVVGGGIAVFALYRYISKQLALAMNWDYKIRYLTISNFDNESVTLRGVLQIINPSNFSLELNSYSLDLYYKGAFLAHAEDNKKILVQPDTTFDAPIVLNVKLSTLGAKALAFGKDVFDQKAIRFGIEGEANVTFGGVTRDIDFDIPDYEYSADLAQEYNVSKPLTEVKDFLCQKLYICV